MATYVLFTYLELDVLSHKVISMSRASITTHVADKLFLQPLAMPNTLIQLSL